MTYLFRICPTNREIIEWKPDLPDTRWGFYKRCDSPNDAKRSFATITGQRRSDDEQMDLLVEAL